MGNTIQMDQSQLPNLPGPMAFGNMEDVKMWLCFVAREIRNAVNEYHRNKTSNAEEKLEYLTMIFNLPDDQIIAKAKQLFNRQQLKSKSDTVFSVSSWVELGFDPKGNPVVGLDLQIPFDNEFEAIKLIWDQLKRGKSVSMLTYTK